jgi:hypothetical protein
MATSVTDAPLSWPARLLLGAFGVLLALGTGEAALRVSHFHFDLVPSLEFGWPDPVTMRDAYMGDPDLVWVTRNYHDILRGAHRTHPAVVFMGDSRTQFGTYPSKTMAALEAAGSTLTSGVKVGVAGWSSSQGLAQLRRDVIPLHPKIVTIYYGWNDHWKAMGLTDPEIMRADRLRALADHLRLAQMWIKFGRARTHRTPAPNRARDPRYRPTPLRWRARQRRGATPVFITAPSNHVAGHEPRIREARAVDTRISCLACRTSGHARRRRGRQAPSATPQWHSRPARAARSLLSKVSAST